MTTFWNTTLDNEVDQHRERVGAGAVPLNIAALSLFHHLRYSGKDVSPSTHGIDARLLVLLVEVVEVQGSCVLRRKTLSVKSVVFLKLESMSRKLDRPHAVAIEAPVESRNVWLRSN